jgi:hypothetical protein
MLQVIDYDYNVVGFMKRECLCPHANVVGMLNMKFAWHVSLHSFVACTAWSGHLPPPNTHTPLPTCTAWSGHLPPPNTHTHPFQLTGCMGILETWEIPAALLLNGAAQ